MSGRAATFVLLYGGELHIDEKFAPSYSGGRNRPLHVPRNIKLEQLKLRVLRALKYDPTKFSVNLICRVPVGNEFVASHVEDDDVCEVLLCQAATEFLIMYVDVEEKIVSEDNIEPPNSERFGSSTQVERVQVANTSRFEAIEEVHH
ncbi:hypothetical protein KFK09_005980 [Dendrobium nobile]|uniref:PB1 domain-containing protein n=1 Tax=Dendrobium nobile TaxID=94219 RepID=A0A8T3BX91_DENNO|nr:hypothetical protein KFK09_006643 [Dendrobium nobile]KAI0523584.1 hypothetical protein KFK09_005980 [Dendrobium nobile]